jgi:hypothetical protein
VLIGDSCPEAGLCGQLAVVRGVNSGACSVFLPDEDRFDSHTPLKILMENGGTVT